MTAYDVIGDVHGHVAKLEGLLDKLGYKHRDGTWTNHERSAVFIGDLIDRGPEQLATLRLVRSMVDAGAAQIVLGNHEFNAVAWSTYDLERADYCRSHSTKNRSQHRGFLGEVVENSARHDEWVAWFKTIPLWLDLGGLRVVHACWDQAAMDAVAPLASARDSLTEDLVIAATHKPTHDERTAGTVTAYDAIENLLKGPEVPLGDDRGYLDRDGNPRYRARFRWWVPVATTLDECVVIPPDARSLDGGEFHRVSAQPIVGQVPAPYTDDTPVIFGHYWCTKESEIRGKKALCVDYSVAERGPLAAYCWDGEPDLSSKELVRY